MTDDDVLFARFCAAGSELTRRGLEQARATSQQLFNDVQELVAEGRGQIELAIRFRPGVSVAVRLVDARGTLVATIASYEATAEPPAAVN